MEPYIGIGVEFKSRDDAKGFYVVHGMADALVLPCESIIIDVQGVVTNKKKS